jgi:cation diffusion facilitator family transporter
MPHTEDEAHRYQYKKINAESESRYSQTKKVSLIGALLNFSLGIIKVVGGFLGGSSALVADGVHSFSDIIADIFVIIASKFSQHDADEDHPYGHRRIETIGTFAVGMFLAFMGFGLGYEAVVKLWMHSLIKPDFFTVWIALISVVGNELVFFYTLKIGKKIRSELVIANAYHSRADSLTSVIVLVGLIGTQMGFPFLDAAAAILVAVYLVKMGVEWGIKALYELADRGLEAEILRQIQTTINQSPGVLHSHRLRTRKMADQVFLDVHLQVSPYITVSEGHYIGENVRMVLGKKFPELFDITVHVDIEEHPEKIPEDLPPSPQVLKQRFLPIWLPFIKDEKNLRKIRVHYFLNAIEIEAVLSLETLSNHQKLGTHEVLENLESLQTLRRNFEDSAQKVPGVAKVAVSFELI